jgi:hypothetical protein
MAISATVANRYKYYLALGKINLETDTIKACLMGSGFTFDVDNHYSYYVAAVSDAELAEGYGYLKDTMVLSGQSPQELDNMDMMEMTAGTLTWTASGGPIGPTQGLILYDDGPAAEKCVIGFLDFGAEQTAGDGTDLVVSNIRVRIT